MPTSDEFLAAARSLADLVAVASRNGVDIVATASQTGLEGDSVVEDSVRAELGASHVLLLQASNYVGNAIDEMVRRAAVCAEYALDMDRWRYAVTQFELVDDGTGRPPPKPPRPYPWVEE